MRTENIPYRSVMKTGGEVSASPDTIQFGILGRLTEPSFPKRPLILVCSAPGKDPAVPGSKKVTDLALDSIDLAKRNKPDDAQRVFDVLGGRFMDLVEHFNLDKETYERMLSQYLEGILTHEAHHGTPEIITARILCDLIPKTLFIHPAEYLQVDKNGQLVFDNERIKGASLRKSIGKQNIGVMPGFIAADVNGRTTTLSRGGSDASAGAISRIVDAPCVIYTNTHGVMSADPSIEPDARPISRLTFDELAEATLGGTYVVHEQTIPPIRHSKERLHIKHYRKPGNKTEVSAVRNGDSHLAEIVTGTKDRRIVTVFRYGVNTGSGFVEDITGVFASAGIAVHDIATATNSVSVSTDGNGIDFHQVQADLERIIPDSIVTIPHVPGTSSVSIIGQNVGTQSAEVLRRAGEALSEIDVSPTMISMPHKGKNMTLYVPSTRFEDSVRAVHAKVIKE